jgi:hypothetical protein
MSNDELKVLIDYHFDYVNKLCKEGVDNIYTLVGDAYLNNFVYFFTGKPTRFDGLNSLIEQLIEERDRLSELREIVIKNNKKRKD